MPFEFHLPSLEDIRTTDDGMAMLRMIDDDDFRSALITGCPGSGKTTVSIYRLVQGTNRGEGVRLLTFHKLLVLAIQNLANVRAVPRGRIDTFHGWQWRLTHELFDNSNPPSERDFFDRLNRSPLTRGNLGELIIDEGQDLPLRVHEVLPHYFERTVVGADKGQQVHPEYGADPEDIEETLGTRYPPYRRFRLARNWRNTYETYAFARQFADRGNVTAWDPNILERLHHAGRHGPKPTVVPYRSDRERRSHLETALRNADGNVAILCPRCAGVDEFYDFIRGIGLPVSKYHHKTGIPEPLERYLVTTYKSAKGMEFDTVVVPRINHSSLIRQEWYVACTRARGQLFVYRDMNGADHDPIADFDPDTYEEPEGDVAPAAPGTTLPF